MTAASHEEQNPAYRSTSAQPKAGRNKGLAAEATWQMQSCLVSPLTSHAEVLSYLRRYSTQRDVAHKYNNPA